MIKSSLYNIESGYQLSSIQDQKLQAIAWIQGSKLANNVLTAIGVQPEVDYDYVQLALQAAQFLNSFIGLTDFLNAPLGIKLNIIEFGIDFGEKGIDLLVKAGNYLGQTTIGGKSTEKIAGVINIGILFMEDVILGYDFYSYTNSNNIVEPIIFYSKFTGDLFKGIAYINQIAGSEEPNEYLEFALGASLILSCFSNILQYFALINEPA